MTTRCECCQRIMERGTRYERRTLCGADSLVCCGCYDTLTEAEDNRDDMECYFTQINQFRPNGYMGGDADGAEFGTNEEIDAVIATIRRHYGLEEKIEAQG